MSRSLFRSKLMPAWVSPWIAFSTLLKYSCGTLFASHSPSHSANSVLVSEKSKAPSLFLCWGSAFELGFDWENQGFHLWFQVSILNQLLCRLYLLLPGSFLGKSHILWSFLCVPLQLLLKLLLPHFLQRLLGKFLGLVGWQKMYLSLTDILLFHQLSPHVRGFLLRVLLEYLQESGWVLSLGSWGLGLLVAHVFWWPFLSRLCLVCLLWLPWLVWMCFCFCELISNHC
jgi:hypothetical protein